MNEKQRNGLWGETIAARFLRGKGYNILLSNYHTRFGEIDLIAQKDAYICFIEVKARSAGALGLPREAVDGNKQRRIALAAADYLQNNPCEWQPRFDVMEVFLGSDRKHAKIRLLENAFESVI